MKTICWFRQDLRLADNYALTHAAQKGDIIPVFILDEEDRELGGASKWWLHHSLKALEKSLGGLIFMRGKPLECLKKLAKISETDRIYWNRSYEPHSVARDKTIKAHFKSEGFEVKSFCGSLVREPWESETGSGGPYKVFTPFWKQNIAKGLPAPIPAPNFKLATLPKMGDQLDAWNLLPTNPDWADGWHYMWVPGETGAANQLDRFLENGLLGYGELRNRPDLPHHCSHLSPHLHFGEISPRQVCAKANFTADQNFAVEKDVAKFIAQIGWRDFSNHLMFHFPEITKRNWKPAFDNYPWVENPEQLKAWQRGQTGYPMVDAGMRELWHTGYMHNRIRMLVASFLVKHLRIHWSAGEAWFWDTLLDADMANNKASWQWVSGSGADAAPYFRIFSPISQGPKFDPNADYVRKWCPELKDLPNKYIHTPFEAPFGELAMAGVKLGETYPQPIVDHKKAREAALAGYQHVKAATHVG